MGRFINLLCNIIWLVLGGLFSALMWTFVGIVLCITIVLIPAGLQCFKIAQMTLLPFGKKIDHGERGSSGWRCCGNILWLPVGLCLGSNHLLWAVGYFMTIVGIPFAWQHIKLAKLSLFPFGARIYDKDIDNHYLPRDITVQV